MRISFAWAVALWTLSTLLAAVLLAAQAVASLYAADQACFFNYPSVPCPGADDPAYARLTFAFFGVPLIWLVGAVVAGAARALQRRRDDRLRG